MNITMNNVHICSIEDIINLLQTPHTITLANQTQEERYSAIRETLTTIKYPTLAKKEKGVVKAFLATVTGYSAQQLKRLIPSPANP